MGAERGRSLTRLWGMVEALRTARRGLTVAQLIERTGGSRASTYRDLNVLRRADVPIDKIATAGEMRYLLAADGGVPARALTPLQCAALLLGRRSLSTLEGTRLLRELDVLMRQAGASPRTAVHVRVPLSHAVAPDRMAVIDRALDQQRCLRLRYRGTNDAAPSWRVVEPVELRVSAQQPYVIAYDRSSERFKTFKLSRISQVQMLNERAHALNCYESDKEFQHSRGIWSGPAQDVAVRLQKEVARLAAEWPLQREQSITDLANGDVIVRARVAGLQEPLRWVLSCIENCIPSPNRVRLRSGVDAAAATNSTDR